MSEMFFCVSDALSFAFYFVCLEMPKHYFYFNTKLNLVNAVKLCFGFMCLIFNIIFKRRINKNAL